MRGVLLLFVLFFQLSVLAQQGNNVSFLDMDSAQQAELLQSRRLILEHFRAGRLDSISLLFDGIDQRVKTLLWPAERLLLYYWIERYSSIDFLAEFFDKLCAETPTNAIPDQTVWNVLSHSSLERIDTLVAWIDQSGCPDDVFNFRVQLLEMMLYSDKEDQKSINDEIKSFVRQYAFVKETPHSVATREESPAEIPDSADEPWHAELSIGLGPTSLSGNIADFLSTKSCLSFNINAYYQRWYFSFLLQAVFAKLKCDIPVGNDVWEAGKSANIFNYGLSFGYSAVDSKYVTLTPFAGLLLSESKPGEQQIDNNEALRNAGIRWGFATMYGLDVKFKIYNMIDLLKRNNYQISLNMKLNYAPAMFSNVNTRYSGNMFFTSFGICMDIYR